MGMSVEATFCCCARCLNDFKLSINKNECKMKQHYDGQPGNGIHVGRVMLVLGDLGSLVQGLWLGVRCISNALPLCICGVFFLLQEHVQWWLFMVRQPKSIVSENPSNSSMESKPRVKLYKYTTLSKKYKCKKNINFGFQQQLWKNIVAVMQKCFMP